MLSTMTGTPRAWATSAMDARSWTSSRGLPIDLEEHRLGVLVDRPAEGGRIGSVDVGRRDADLRQGMGEQVVRAAIERRRRHDVVAGPRQVQDRQRLGRLARGDAQRRHAALQRGDALLEDVGRRIHDPGVDVAELLQPEQPRGMRGVVEHVARGRVDRDGPGVRRRVRLLAGMKGPSLRAEGRRIEFGHVGSGASCGFVDKQKDRGSSVESAAPGPSLRSRSYVISNVRVTSDPCLPAGPHAHTHVRAGRGHRSGMVKERRTGRQPWQPIRNTGDALGFRHDRHPRDVPRLCRREDRA